MHFQNIQSTSAIFGRPRLSILGYKRLVKLHYKWATDTLKNVFTTEGKVCNEGKAKNTRMTRGLKVTLSTESVSIEQKEFYMIYAYLKR